MSKPSSVDTVLPNVLLGMTAVTGIVDAVSLLALGHVFNPEVNILWLDEQAHRAAMSFLLARLDKTYSLCVVRRAQLFVDA